MKAGFPWLLFLLCWLSACHPKPASKVQDSGNVSDSTRVTMKNDSTPHSQDIGGKETCLGPKTVRGFLHHTKGRLGSVGGYLLSGQYLAGGGSGNWLPAYEALVGKEVEVQGVHYRYRCSPIEQCLEGGVIDYLREIVYLKAVE